jgi:hypothetical protein
MTTWKKPASPPATLTRTDDKGLPENITELHEAGQRTRRPMQNTGTWGDTVYPGAHHTDDPKAPKVSKVL